MAGHFENSLTLSSCMCEDYLSVCIMSFKKNFFGELAIIIMANHFLIWLAIYSLAKPETQQLFLTLLCVCYNYITVQNKAMMLVHWTNFSLNVHSSMF